MSLSVYDGVMLTIVIVCVIQGALKGMAWQLAPIASLVLGYLFAVPLSAATAPWFGQPPLNRVFAMVTMYMLVSLGVYLIARSLRETIEKTKLLEFDRHLGALFGGVKGVLFTTVLTVGLVCVSPTAAGLIVHSESRGIAENIIDYVKPLLPKDVYAVIDPYLKPIEDLPDEEEPRRPVAEDDSPFKIEDLVKEKLDPFAPRTRRHQPIYDDDLEAQSDEESMPDEPLTRRRKTTDDSRDYDSADADHDFGSDPDQAFEEDRPTKRR